MEYPQTIYIYRQNNNPDYSLSIALSPEEIPSRTKIGVYKLERMAKIETMLSDDIAEEPIIVEE